MKKALVTGGCGFLGSWITRQLVADGVSVRVLAVPGEDRENIADLNVEVIEGDVTSRADAERAVAGMDTVFHAAAIYKDWAPDPTQMSLSSNSAPYTRARSQHTRAKCRMSGPCHAARRGPGKSPKQFDTESRTVINGNVPLPGCVVPVGVSIDVDGFVWAPDQGANLAYKVDPVTYASTTTTGLVQPYTYSDMTGAGLGLVSNPPAG